MSRFHPGWALEPLFEAATFWKTHCLLADGSIFSSEPIWTGQNIEALKKYFVDNLDYGEGNFLSKLRAQIEPAGASANKLAAEITWLMLLCPSNISQSSKRTTIKTIWEWSGDQFPSNSRWIADAVLVGVGSAGTAYNTARWRELMFAIQFLRNFREQPIAKQNRLVEDGWAMAEWIDSVPDSDNRQLRYMLLYLLFPDQFERVFSSTDRRKLLSAFQGTDRRVLRELSRTQIDRELLKIRENKERELATKAVDFYMPPLKEVWKVEEPGGTGSTQPGGEPPSVDERTLSIAAAAVKEEHIRRALEAIDRDGIPHEARSTTYDLIEGSKRYPPKYVLSLAIKLASGIEYPRREFSGGEDSQAFKLIRERGFYIERKLFLRDLLKQFLAQANEGTSLVVSDYPKSYRGLAVNVSFGKGNFAKIPWISFTGYDQLTSNGIYPVLLYYRGENVIVVAYGISETKAPIVRWQGVESSPTIAAHLEAQFGFSPERYGDSFVHEAFQISEGVDDEAVEKALDKVIGQYHRQFRSLLGGPLVPHPVLPPKPAQSYSLEEAVRGVFIEERRFAEILELLKLKRNLILQGPPGVGKTFVCKRLAYALMGEKAPARFQMVQFHPSYSYEDFVQGYRPSGTGFRLKNGLFFEFCERARNDPANSYVFVIDEINRGNLSKVLGEAMMLIEADKRSPEWAIPLAYAEEESDRFYVPPNLYLIGLMNTADRSLAMVDYALRRRFAFVELPPGFDTDEFWDYLEEQGAEPEFIDLVVERMNALNQVIASDTANLGPGYCVGHSYFCSGPLNEPPNWSWFRRIVKAEVEPLLKEYFFDNPKKVADLVDQLLRER